jgi:hypothetical protein
VNINKNTRVISPEKMNFNEEQSCGRIYFEKSSFLIGQIMLDFVNFCAPKSMFLEPLHF